MSYEVRLEEDGDYAVLRILRNGALVEEEHDSGEPEDNSFARDWCWVPVALRRAYSFGIEDGRRRLPQDINPHNLPRARHHIWWLIHNLVAHPAIGLVPSKTTFDFHDWTSRKLNGL